MNPIVVDISHWNPTPNWTMLASNGTIGVIHKCTEGTDYVDPEYAIRGEEAMDAGLMWAAYHFLHHGDIDEQMEHYVAMSGVIPGGRVIIDFEEPDTDLKDLEDAVLWLLDYGYAVTVYGDGHLSDVLRNATSAVLTGTTLWQARYSSDEPDVPSPWPHWSLWQYSDSVVVKGIDEPVDANEWHSSPEELIEWFSGKKPWQPELPMSELPVINITVEADRDVVLYVNGKQVSL